MNHTEVIEREASVDGHKVELIAYSVTEAAEALGCSVSLIWKLIASGGIHVRRPTCSFVRS